MKSVPIGVDLHPGFTSERWLMFWEEAEESGGVKQVPMGVDLHPGFTSGRWLMFWEEVEESEDQLGRICTLRIYLGEME